MCIRSLPTTVSLFLLSGLSLILNGCGIGCHPIALKTYQTVYGDPCAASELTPGCTFLKDGSRVKVAADPAYNKTGKGSDDLWYVTFATDGSADVYNEFGVLQYSSNASQFAGYVSGTMIGVGVTGLYWEDVAGQTYWIGKNGVLYNAMSGDSKYGEAINNKDAGQSTDMNFSALSSETNKKLVKMAADGLAKKYGFTKDNANAIATALNVWAVSASERGYTTDRDLSKTFQAVFGVDYPSAMAAVKELTSGNKDGIRAVTNRSAEALGLKPSQAQDFIKGMFSDAAASFGYNVYDYNW